MFRLNINIDLKESFARVMEIAPGEENADVHPLFGPVSHAEYPRG